MILSDMLESFLSDKYIYCPYREHRINYWNIPDYQNILYLTYESVVRDIEGAIRKVAMFLNVTVSNENLMMLNEHLKFDNMKSEFMLSFVNRVSNLYEHVKALKCFYVKHLIVF